MTQRTGYFCSWRSMVFAASALAPLLAGPARAEHNYQSDNFDSGAASPGWSPATVTADPLGGYFLGPLTDEPAKLLIMDALPALNPLTGDIDSSPRRARIEFDLRLPWIYIATDMFRLTANGDTILEQTIAQLYVISGGNGVAHLRTGYNLTASPLFQPSDLVLQFSLAADPAISTPLGWGLDNVVVDWSRPVPEPATWALAALAAAGLFWGLERGKVGRGAKNRSTHSVFGPRGS